MYANSLDKFPQFRREDAPKWTLKAESSDSLLRRPCDSPQPGTSERAIDLAGVSLWYVRHGTALECALSDLSLTEQDFAEFAHVRYAPGRRRSLRARARLRGALSAFTGGSIAPSGWTFARDHNGKPYLPEATGLHFSCSHSALISVIAVAVDRPIGVDIAVVTPDQDLSLIDGFLARNERRALTELPEDARPQALARIWALKEATIKMLGIGFSFDLSRLDFSVDQNALHSIQSEIAELSDLRVSATTICERSRVYSVAIASGR